MQQEINQINDDAARLLAVLKREFDSPRAAFLASLTATAALAKSFGMPADVLCDGVAAAYRDVEIEREQS